MKQTLGPVIGAPSFVLPANVADNARFLAGRVDEVALCLSRPAPAWTTARTTCPPRWRTCP